MNALPMIGRMTITRLDREQREEGGARGAFAAELQREGLTPQSDTTISRVPAPGWVAEVLGVPQEARCWLDPG